MLFGYLAGSHFFKKRARHIRVYLLVGQAGLAGQDDIHQRLFKTEADAAGLFHHPVPMPLLGLLLKGVEDPLGPGRQPTGSHTHQNFGFIRIQLGQPQSFRRLHVFQGSDLHGPYLLRYCLINTPAFR
jgi:hypothetical protein